MSTTTSTAEESRNDQNTEGCGPEMPAPVAQHQWLQRLVGEWETETEVFMGPDQPPLKNKGTNRARMLGGFWLIEEGENSLMPYSFILTLGYDVAKQAYVASWVDSMMGHLWRYEGSLDASGNVLTMETEGPNPCGALPGKLVKFRDVTEFKSDNHRMYTSSMLGDDGQWTRILTVNLRRK